jgi:hypothetical protein
MADIKPGWAVVGNDGRRVGEVREVGQNYVLTSSGGFGDDVYVPASAIANVEHDVLHLSIPQRDVGEMGWEQAPRDDDSRLLPSRICIDTSSQGAWRIGRSNDGERGGGLVEVVMKVARCVDSRGGAEYAVIERSLAR